jgi:hypothetical protein
MARRSVERPRSLAAVRRGVAWLVGEGVAAGWATSEWIADRVVAVVRRGRRIVGDRDVAGARRSRR